jgi:hypothetical protein
VLYLVKILSIPFEIGFWKKISFRGRAQRGASGELTKRGADL